MLPLLTHVSLEECAYLNRGTNVIVLNINNYLTPIKRLQNVSFVFSLSLFFRIKQLFCPGEQTSSNLMLKTGVDLQVSFTMAVKTKAEEKEQAFPPGLIE